jgi:Asp-tRNA(Asn)/Glu-tRNA(Gln) amidotransferase A subunit family amidase
VRQYTAGWQHTDPASKETYENFLRNLSTSGIEVVDPKSSEELAAYEDATTRTPEFFFDLMLWEIRWPFRAWREINPQGLSEPMTDYIKRAEAMSAEDYRRAVARREDLRARHRALRGRADGFITLAHIGAGQLGQPRGGTPWYNDASSAIGAPTYNLPLLSVEGLPLGVQLMGFEGDDADLAALARGLLDAFGSPTVGPG